MNLIVSIRKLNDREISFNFVNKDNLIDIAKSLFYFKSSVEQNVLSVRLMSKYGFHYCFDEDTKVSKLEDGYYCVSLKAKPDVYTGLDLYVNDNKVCSDFAMKLVEGEPKPEKKALAVQTDEPTEETLLTLKFLLSALLVVGFQYIFYKVFVNND